MGRGKATGKAKSSSGANLGFEQTLWQTADKLRGNIDAAAARWCENASQLSSTEWKYTKVPQKEFQTLQPLRLADLSVLWVFSLS